MKTIARAPLFLFLILILCSVKPVHAQLFDYGLRGGANFAQFSNVDDSEFHVGYHFGAFLNISPPLSPVAIQPELLYTQFGSKFEFPGDILNGSIGLPNSTVTETMKMNYLQIPVLVKYYFPLPGPVSPNMYAGPYVGFHLDSSYDGDEDFADDWEDSVRDTDYGLVLGLGTEINILLNTIHIDARYILGLESIFEEPLDNDEKHRVISVSLGFAF